MRNIGVTGVQTCALPIFTPGLPGGAAPTSPAVARTIWLARTGGLPGRSLAGYRRWALTPPFHPSPVPDGSPLSGHRLVYSLLHLTWRRAYAAPPLGFLARAAFPGVKVAPSRVRTLLCEPTLRGQDHSDGSDGPEDHLDIIP